MRPIRSERIRFAILLIGKALVKLDVIMQVPFGIILPNSFVNSSAKVK